MAGLELAPTKTQPAISPLSFIRKGKPDSSKGAALCPAAGAADTRTATPRTARERLGVSRLKRKVPLLCGVTEIQARSGAIGTAECNGGDRSVRAGSIQWNSRGHPARTTEGLDPFGEP